MSLAAETLVDKRRRELKGPASESNPTGSRQASSAMGSTRRLALAGMTGVSGTLVWIINVVYAFVPSGMVSGAKLQVAFIGWLE